MGNYVWMSPRLGNKWKFNPNIQGFPQTVGGSSSFPSNIGCFYTDFWPISSTAVLDLLIHRRLPTQFGRGAKSCLIPSSWGKSYSTENLLNVLKKKKKRKLPLRSRMHPNSHLKSWRANLGHSKCFVVQVRRGRWGRGWQTMKRSAPFRSLDWRRGSRKVEKQKLHRKTVSAAAFGHKQEIMMIKNNKTWAAKIKRYSRLFKGQF